MALIDKRNSSKTCRFRHWIEQAKLFILVISFLKISPGYMEVDLKQNDWQLHFPLDSLEYNDYLWMALIIKRNLILTCGFHHWIEQTKLLFLVIKFLTRLDTRPSVACGWAGAVMLKNRRKSCTKKNGGPKDRRTDGRTHPLIESLARD